MGKRLCYCVRKWLRDGRRAMSLLLFENIPRTPESGWRVWRKPRPKTLLSEVDVEPLMNAAFDT